MNYRKKLQMVFIIMTMACGVVGCGKDSSSLNINNQDVVMDSEVASCSEDYFKWENNLIIGLTDEGAKQETLVIPERCEGFRALIFGDKENVVKHVSFESEKDIPLNCVFSCNDTLVSVDLPEELSEIADSEFWRAKALEKITIPSNVTTIGKYAFFGDKALKEVEFNGEITEILMHAFDGCSLLSTISLPDTITSIEEYAFYECESLVDVTLPSDLSDIGGFAYANSGIQTITVPENLELNLYTTTSFVQSDHDVMISVVEGSWMDVNFESVFDGAFYRK